MYMPTLRPVEPLQSILMRAHADNIVYSCNIVCSNIMCGIYFPSYRENGLSDNVNIQSFYDLFNKIYGLCLESFSRLIFTVNIITLVIRRSVFFQITHCNNYIAQA